MSWPEDNELEKSIAPSCGKPSAFMSILGMDQFRIKYFPLCKTYCSYSICLEIR